MKELKVDAPSTREIFVNAFNEMNIVPIIGGGFTSGAPAQKQNTVPNGKELKQYMINRILRKQKDISKEELEIESFSSVAGMFEELYKDVKNSDVTDYFLNHFTGVRIESENKRNLLNKIKWEYIYTLNIDNGIESTAYGEWEVFYPNKDFDEKQDFGEKKKLYKVHGDANRFVKTMDYGEMILTDSQYISSLSNNQKFHDLLTADCENKNLLYIGCSLDDEIDIKYSVLSDKNRNFKERETFRIYVTAEPISSLKKMKLEGFNISHYIQLQTNDDYDLFYEFLYSCYEESCANQHNVGIENLRYKCPVSLDNNLNANIDFLADIGTHRNSLPYYYVERELFKKIKLSQDKINVIIGRRFAGKTMLAHNILNYYQNIPRFFITAQESVDKKTIAELMIQKNALIVFDSDSIDDSNFGEIFNKFDCTRGNTVLMFINSYSDIFDLVNYHANEVNQPIDHNIIGKMSETDIENINRKLNTIGIPNFDAQQNILDNTLRIANLYDRRLVEEYTIDPKEDLVIIIWLLVENKMYYEEIVTLGLSNKYKEVVEKFSPFLQIEKCKKSESRKHSFFKIVCNGKLGLLQILNNFVYPCESSMGNVAYKMRQEYICESIYKIMYAYEKCEKSVIRKFIMFDTLNDIFSKKYSKRNIGYLSSNDHNKSLEGAAGLIQAIYNNEKIQSLKGDDPNYWLQRAKSVYITYYRSKAEKLGELYEGIKWAIKAEQDALIKVQNGEKQYLRTMSNATIQIAIMYGRVTKICNYRNIGDNDKAVEYYYKGFSDINNLAAVKSILQHSKGINDFKNLVQELVQNPSQISSTLRKERDYLINVNINNQDVIYST